MGRNSSNSEILGSWQEQPAGNQAWNTKQGTPGFYQAGFMFLLFLLILSACEILSYCLIIRHRNYSLENIIEDSAFFSFFFFFPEL